MRRWPRSAHGSAATCLAATERKLNEIAAATRFRTWLPRRRQRDAANPTGFEAHCAWVRLSGFAGGRLSQQQGTHCQLGPSNVHGEGVVTDKTNADRFAAYDVLALTECCGLPKDIVCGFKSPCSRLGLAGRWSCVYLARVDSPKFTQFSTRFA